MNKDNGIWIIIPGYNEEKYIATVLEKTQKYTKNIVVVDDGSKDKTYTIAKKHNSHVLRHPVNLGKGAALRTGCKYAFEYLGAKAVIFMDSDDQHDPAELKLFYEKLEKGSSVVLGIRSFDNKMPLAKIFLNRLASVFIMILFGKYIPDIPSGFKAITKKAYGKLEWNSRDYTVEVEIATKLARYKIPFSEVPIKTIYHDFDRGMTILDTLDMIRKIFIWRLTL